MYELHENLIKELAGIRNNLKTEVAYGITLFDSTMSLDFTGIALVKAYQEISNGNLGDGLFMLGMAPVIVGLTAPLLKFYVDGITAPDKSLDFYYKQ